MIKHCVICGAEFSAPPSDTRRTCSDICSHKLRSASQKSRVRRPWSDSARDSARRAAEKTGNLKDWSVTLAHLPEGQRGPQNREAKAWYLVSPDGTPETVINLYDWARAHARDYFDMEPTDSNAHSIASGFYQIKRSALGKFRRRNGQPVSVTTYKGWRLTGWGDGNTVYKTQPKNRVTPDRSEYNRQYYAANKERISAQSKAAREAKKAAEAAALSNNTIKEDPHND